VAREDSGPPAGPSGTGIFASETWTFSVEVLAAYRTRRNPLTCGFATPWHSPTLTVPPGPSAKRPWSLRDRLDERDIDGLIPAHREGVIATGHGLSLTSVKHLLHIAGVHRTSPTRQATKATPAAPHP
jgi:hypothetical protein